MSKGVKYSDELVAKIIQHYQEGYSPYWMVQNLEELQGKRPSVVYGILNRNGFKGKPLTDEQRKSRRKYNVNDDIFEVIDTEEKAYWLGFLYADGYVTSDEDKVGLSISVNDIEHLERFKEFLQTTAPINIYNCSGYNNDNKYCRLIVTSRKMKNDLMNLGVVPHKTTIITFPQLDEKLVPHFIRGYFDGDGSWSFNANRDEYQFKVCGTKEFLEGMLRHIGTETKLYQRYPERNVNNWYTSIGGRQQVLSIMKYLYDDATIYLERKYKKYTHLKQLINQYSRPIQK